MESGADALRPPGWPNNRPLLLMPTLLNEATVRANDRLNENIPSEEIDPTVTTVTSKATKCPDNNKNPHSRLGVGRGRFGNFGREERESG